MQCLRVEDPVLNVAVSLVGRVLSLVPVGLDLLGEALRIVLGALLCLLAASGQVVGEGLGIPRCVGVDNLVIPVVGDGLLKVLTIRRTRVRDVVVRQPALELRLVPLVVDCLSMLV
jgi:hypothetical protein